MYVCMCGVIQDRVQKQALVDTANEPSRCSTEDGRLLNRVIGNFSSVTPTKVLVYLVITYLVSLNRT